jgi:hypothetical protein
MQTGRASEKFSCLGKYGRMVEGLKIAPQRLTAAIETCEPICRPFGLVGAKQIIYSAGL